MTRHNFKPITPEDIQKLLTPEEMKAFAAGARFLFGNQGGDDDAGHSTGADDGDEAESRTPKQ